MTDLSVIIPTLKPREEIVCLHDLEQQEFEDYEVIVRDDERATTARNEGIRRAKADKLVFLDDDSRPAEGYLERMSNALDDESAVAGKIVHPRNDIIKRFTSHYAPADSPKYVTRFWGCNMGVRAEVFEQVGMWDENITWGHEEKELAERVLGEYPIYYDPDLLVYHTYADSVPDLWKKHYRLERQTPYLWEKDELSEHRQWTNILKFMLNPMNYLGFTPKHTVARGGKAVAQTAGRVHGMFSKP